MEKIYIKARAKVNLGLSILENLALADNKGKTYGLSFGINKKRISYYKDLLLKLDLGLENKLYNKPCAISETGERRLPNGWIFK